jgi:outer membrane protein TolC
MWRLCVVAGLSLACATQAQPANDVAVASESSSIQETTLAMAVDAAWGRAVAAAESTGHIRQAQAELHAASAWWAAPPSVELAHRTDRLQTNRGARETEVALAVPIWLPGQKAARQQAADASLALSRLSEAEGKLLVAESVRELLWQVALLRAGHAISREQAATLKAISMDVDKRVAAGDLARADALAAKGELLSAQAAQIQAGTQLEAAQRQWLALTGLQQIPDTGPGAMEPITPRSLERHPGLASAAQQVELSHRRLDLVAKSGRSAPEIVTRLRQDVGGYGQRSAYSVGVAVRIPLGTADRNAPMEAAALTDLEVAQSKEQVRRAAVAAGVDNAKAAAQSLQLQLEAERSKASMFRERAQLIRTAFDAGETSLPELLRATNAAAQADFAVARQEAALGLARARLQQAYGQLP